MSKTRDVEGHREDVTSRMADELPPQFSGHAMRLRAMQDEIRRLRSERDEAATQCHALAEQWEAQKDRADRAEAALGRRDTALREIRDVYAETPQQALHKATGIADRALAPVADQTGGGADRPAGVYEDGLVRIHPHYFNRLLELEREAIERGEASPMDLENRRATTEPEETRDE